MRNAGRTLVSALIVGTVLGTVVPSTVAATRDDAARRGADWLVSNQDKSGAFFGDPRADLTAETLAAVVAAGVGGQPVDRAMDYVRKKGKAGATRGGFTGRIIAGIAAGGGDPRSFGGTDYVAILNSQYDAASGAYDTFNFFSDLVAANGALAGGEKLPDKAVAYIAANECAAGGLGSQKRCPDGPDVDTTSWAINVLIATGNGSDPVIARAREWLLSVQRPDGGFSFAPGQDLSSDSTGLALSAIAALGEDAQGAPWEQDDGDDPVSALLGLQHPSGGFRPNPSNQQPNGLATTDVVPGLAGDHYPIKVASPTTNDPDPSTEPSPSSDPGGDPGGDPGADPDGPQGPSDDPGAGDPAAPGAPSGDATSESSTGVGNTDVARSSGTGSRAGGASVAIATTENTTPLFSDAAVRPAGLGPPNAIARADSDVIATHASRTYVAVAALIAFFFASSLTLLFVRQQSMRRGT